MCRNNTVEHLDVFNLIYLFLKTAVNGIVFVIRTWFEHQGLICSIVVSAAQICVFAWLLCQLDEMKKKCEPWS